MVRAAFKSLFARKMRLVLTAISIVLGVGFVAGTYIFTDTIQATFDELYGDLYDNTDVVVQAETEFDQMAFETPPFDEAILDTVRQVPGVAAAEGGVIGYTQMVKDGKAIEGVGGAPSFGVAMPDNENMPTVGEFREGAAPAAPGEIAVDAKTAELHELSVGDRVELLVPIGTAEAEVVAIFGFGESDNLAGAVVIGFETSEAQRVLGLEGQFQSIDVVGTGDVSAEALRDRIAAAIPDGLEAVVGAEQADALSGQLREGLAPLTNTLLAFAAVALLTGAFIIQNTFRIIMSQRIREFAMMRAVGASGRQLVTMVTVEAFAVALVASGIGILVGIFVASMITAMFESVGLTLATVSPPILPRTIIVALLVGVGVTLASVLPPAIRAARVPPLAALRDVELTSGSLRRRGVVGVLVLGVGLVLAVMGLFGDVPDIGPLTEGLTLAVGAFVVFIGVSILSALFVRPFAAAIAAPIVRLGRVTGRLAKENSIRRPRRTAATAAALMIGLASITFFSVLQSSQATAVEAAVDDTMRADFLVAAVGAGVTPALGEELAAAPEVGSVLAVRGGMWDDDGSTRFVAGVDPQVLPEMLDLGMQEGSVAGLAGDGILVEAAIAADRGWSVGDSIQMGFASTGRVDVELAGTFDSTWAPSPYLVGIDFFDAHYASQQLDVGVYAALAEGVALAEGRAVIDTAAAAFPSVEVFDVGELKAEIREDLDRTLALITGLLVFAVLIALLGIANTLVLSVFERTREIGLLRAVGMSRRQVRRMVRWEALIVALLGGVLGLAVGGFFGILIVVADDAMGTAALTIPFGLLVTVLAGAVVAGVIASIGPARKAARQNILTAIAYE